jgi:TatA/E family protein of Tat protein translocase
MFGHPLELVVVFIIGLIVFGPKKLPEITRNVGRGLNAFKKGMDGFNMQGEDVDEAAMVQRRRDLAELELQILEKKEELARHEMGLDRTDFATASAAASAEPVTEAVSEEDDAVTVKVSKDEVQAASEVVANENTTFDHPIHEDFDPLPMQNSALNA